MISSSYGDSIVRIVRNKNFGRLLTSLVIFLGASAATAVAQSQTDSSPRLTPISGSTGDDCSVSLDLHRSVIVLYATRSGSRVGIDGRTYNLNQADGRYDSTTGAYTYRSNDGRMSVRRQPLRTITSRSADIVVSSLTITVNGRSSVIEVYFWCPPGD